MALQSRDPKSSNSSRATYARIQNQFRCYDDFRGGSGEWIFPAAWQRPPLNPNGMPGSHGSGNEDPFSRSDAMEKPLVKKL
jgi:hypothetical protein